MLGFGISTSFQLVDTCEFPFAPHSMKSTNMGILGEFLTGLYVGLPPPKTCGFGGICPGASILSYINFSSVSVWTVIGWPTTELRASAFVIGWPTTELRASALA